MPNPIKIKASVEFVVPHGDGVYTVAMRPPGRIPRFKAGQFLHLTVDEYDPAGGFWPESRVFSIASSPGSDLVSILYSVKGVYTRKMEACLKPGTDVWLKMPYGEFVIESFVRERQDIVLVAGGTGISPFIPYLEELSRKKSAIGKIAVHYGARLRSNVLFRDLLERCAESITDFEATLWIENESSDGLGIRGVLARDGRLSIDTIYEEAKAANDPFFFLSGPPAMITLFKQSLQAKGVISEKIKIDEWE